MRVLCKSCITEAEIEKRLELGFHNFEIQLTEKSELHKYLAKYTEMDVWSIHTPLSSRQELCIHDVCYNDDAKDLFYWTCTIAEEAAEMRNHNVLVVIHNRLLASTLHSLMAMDYVAEVMNECLLKFPNVVITLENMPILYKGHACECCRLDDLGELCSDIQCRLHYDVRDRFGITLDTCHWLMSDNVLQDHDCMLDQGDDRYAEDFSTTLLRNRIFIKNIHFNNVFCAGMNKSTHSQPFQDADLPFISMLLDKVMLVDPFITLEVNEEDYTNPINLPAQYNMLLKAVRDNPSIQLQS